MTDSLRRLALLVVAAAAVGVVVAAMLGPVVAGVGLISNRVAETWTSQQCGLAEQSVLPQKTHIVAADGTRIADFYYQNRVAVTFEQIPLVMREAVIAIEDSRFYQHNGVDLRGTIRALVHDSHSGQAVQGGSTLTQQYVKNMFLLQARTKAEQQAAIADTVSRKLREARCAIEIEQKMTKEQILAGYLNIAYFGEGAYGVAAAAQRYFGVPVGRLTLPQAALLAGLVQNPSAYDPLFHPDTAKTRRSVVLQRMADVGYLTAAKAGLTDALPLGLNPKVAPNGCEASQAPYFCQWVIDQIRRSPAFGETPDERITALLRGGLTIRTTLDWRVQRAAQAAVNRYVPDSRKKNPRRLGSAVVVVQPGTGAVKAMAVNLPYGNGAGQNANNLALGGTSGFQAGSTFKLFTLVTALEQGVPATFRLAAPNVYYSSVFPGYSRAAGGVRNAGDSEACYCDLVQATADSVNTYFVQLEEKVGVTNVAATARKMGVNLTAFPGSRQPTQVDGSLTLGTWSVDPLEMAEAYATMAARGRHCDAFGVLAATDAAGRPLRVAGPRCQQVIDQGVADTATQILTHVISGPGSHTGGNADIGRPAAGKTGTTTGYGAAWFDGYTPQLATAVWMGDPSGLKQGLVNFQLDGQHVYQVYGGDFPAKIWAATMKNALDAMGAPALAFPPADPKVTYGAHITMPDLTGLSPTDALAKVAALGLTGMVAPQEMASGVRAGLVAQTTPAAGSSLTPGETVTLTLSTGTPPPPPPPPPTAQPPVTASPPASPTPTASPTASPSHRPSTSPTPTPRPSTTTSHAPSPAPSPSPSKH